MYERYRYGKNGIVVDTRSRVTLYVQNACLMHWLASHASRHVASVALSRTGRGARGCAGVSGGRSLRVTACYSKNYCLYNYGNTPTLSVSPTRIHSAGARAAGDRWRCTSDSSFDFVLYPPGCVQAASVKRKASRPRLCSASPWVGRKVRSGTRPGRTEMGT